MCVCVCERVCERVCACVCSQEPLVYHMNVLVMTAVLCVVRSCSAPGVWCGSVLTTPSRASAATYITSFVFTVCKELTMSTTSLPAGATVSPSALGEPHTTTQHTVTGECVPTLQTVL